MPDNIPEYKEYKILLKKRLKESRYLHSLAVADEAYRLAIKYGGDAEKAYLAGLLHDITKNASQSEHLNIFDTFGIILNETERSAEKLWHAISGAAYIEYVLNIKDSELIEAVRYHTTARADLPQLAKILYLADFTSSDRDYDDVDVMRKLVDESLDKAYAYALRYTVMDLASLNRAIHRDTFEAYNETFLKGVDLNGV